MNNKFNTLRDELYNRVFTALKEGNGDSSKVIELLERVTKCSCYVKLELLAKDIEDYFNSLNKNTELDVVREVINFAKDNNLISDEDSKSYEETFNRNDVSFDEICYVLSSLTDYASEKINDYKKFLEKIGNIVLVKKGSFEIELAVTQEELDKVVKSIGRLTYAQTFKVSNMDEIREAEYKYLLDIIRKSAQRRPNPSNDLSFCLMLKNNFGTTERLEKFISDVKESME